MSAPPALPPDRSHIRTEHRHPDSFEMDRLETADLVTLLIEDQATVANALRDAAPAIAAFLESLAPRVRTGGRLVYLGAGTSGRLGVLDASECPPTFQSDPSQIVGIIAGGDASLRRSSEGKEDDANGANVEFERLAISSGDTVLGIAAGGTTPYVIGGLSLAHRRGAMTALLCCAPLSNPPHVDHIICVDTGPELLTGSTRLKAGTATKIVLNTITTGLFVRLGKVYGNMMVDLRATNNKLLDRAVRIIREFCPGLTREQAAALLQSAAGDVKTAVIMHRLGVEAEPARRVLQQADQSLRQALATPAPSPARS